MNQAFIIPSPDGDKIYFHPPREISEEASDAYNRWLDRARLSKNYITRFKTDHLQIGVLHDGVVTAWYRFSGPKRFKLKSRG